jgi:signal transduction histidine kinase
LHGLEISEIHQSVKSVIQTTNNIIKAHGGEIKAETKEGEGTEFIIHLPVV